MPDPETASSPALGIAILLIITFALAALVLLCFSLPKFDLGIAQVPEIFKITKIRHENERGKMNYDSYMVVMNTGTAGYCNKDLYAKTFRNGRELDCKIPTMNGHDFIDGSDHHDVQNLAGHGAEGAIWYPNAMIWIDYEDRTFRPGDTIGLEVYNRSTRKIISRSLFRA